jgi:predicted DCC family thiol-disulfide oxidoreductase YuxK
MTVDNNHSGVVIFDGVCNLCNGAVNFIIKRDPDARFRFIPSQSDLAGQLASQHNIQEPLGATFVLIQENKYYFRSDAAFEIASQLTGGWRFLLILRLIPSGLRDWVYGLVAGHRYGWFGRRDVCMTPADDVASRFVS